MSEKPNLQPLSGYERRELLEKFLAALNDDQALAPARAILRTRDDRYLALVAAIERSVLRGSPSAAPPHSEDEADQLLCDILDALNNHPSVKNHGAYYGSYQHLSNLQALGLWRGDAPLARPSAYQLFAARFSALTADSVTTLPASDTNFSPPCQHSGPNGDLISGSATATISPPDATPPPQLVDSVLVLTITPSEHGITEISYALQLITA